MNGKQMIVVAIAAIIVGATFLFPPWITLEFPDSGQANVLLTHSERRLFNNPPTAGDVKAPYIAWRYPIQDAIVAIVVAGVLCFFLRTKKPREEVATDCPGSTAAF